MSKINGTLFRLKIGSYLVGSSTDMEFSIEQDDPKTTNQDGNGFEASLDQGGIRRASGSVNALIDADNNMNSEELIDYILSNSGLLSAQYGVVGGKYYSSSIKVLSVKSSGSTENPTAISMSWVSSGAVTENQSIYGYLTYDEDGTPVSGATILVNDIAQPTPPDTTPAPTTLYSGTTDSNGRYEIWVPNGTYYLYGTNTAAWSGVTTSNVNEISRYILGLTPNKFTGKDLRIKAADIINNGSIDGNDVTQLSRRIAGLTYPSWSIADWIFENPVVTVNGANYEKNIKCICAGDCGVGCMGISSIATNTDGTLVIITFNTNLNTTNVADCYADFEDTVNNYYFTASAIGTAANKLSLTVDTPYTNGLEIAIAKTADDYPLTDTNSANLYEFGATSCTNNVPA